MKTAIINVLRACDALVKRVGNRIFYLRTGAPAPAPWVLVNGLRTDYSRTKDGLFPLSTEFVVNIISKSAEEAEELADIVQGSLHGKILPQSFDEVILASRSEDYDFEQDAYVYLLTFNINH